MSQVKYWRNHEDSEGGAQRVVVPGTKDHTRLEGMKANSNYLVEVRGYNSAGYGPPSKHLTIHTKKARMLCFKAVQYIPAGTCIENVDLKAMYSLFS